MSAIAQEETPNLVLTFVDAVTMEPIDQVFVSAKFNDKTSTYYLEKNENLKLVLPEGKYFIQFLFNNPATEGYDYYGEAYFPISNTLVKVIYVYPVASINGFVKDNLNNVIQHAELKFECNRAFQVDYPAQADKFGSFSLDYAPVGKCALYGSYAGFVGKQEVELHQGDKINVDIILDQVLVQNRTSYGGVLQSILITLGVLGGGILIFIIHTALKKKKGKNSFQKEDELLQDGGEKELVTVSNVGQRGNDIYKTLRDNEKKIVNFLLQEKEPVHLSKIHYKTGISKGAVFRNLHSLELKNIIEQVREGRVRKAKLSSWFLEQ